jgi:hypothetical protein
MVITLLLFFFTNLRVNSNFQLRIYNIHSFCTYNRGEDYSDAVYTVNHFHLSFYLSTINAHFFVSWSLLTPTRSSLCLRHLHGFLGRFRNTSNWHKHSLVLRSQFESVKIVFLKSVSVSVSLTCCKNSEELPEDFLDERWNASELQKLQKKSASSVNK